MTIESPPKFLIFHKNSQEYDFKPFLNPLQANFEYKYKSALREGGWLHRTSQNLAYPYQAWARGGQVKLSQPLFPFSHLDTSIVCQAEQLLNYYGIFWKLKIKNSIYCTWKNNFAFSYGGFFSVLRVWLLFTVTMDHPVGTLDDLKRRNVSKLDKWIKPDMND